MVYFPDLCIYNLASRDKKPPKVKKAPLPKGPRPPNWRVKPNPAVKTVWEKDPFFEMREVVPFVSSINYSKLLFRAVAKKDNALLKQYIADREHTHSLSIKKSMADNMTPLDYAVKMENIPAMKILHNAMKEDGKGKKKRRVGAPTCMMATVGTGTYNWRSLGIKKIRKLNMSRGGREGNNALVKDVGNEFGSGPNETSVMYWGVSMKTINELLAMGLINKHSLIDSGVVDAIAAGHTEVPATLIEKDLKQNTMGSQFNHFHHEALTRGNAAWKGPIREVSCRKQGPSGLTPMHCAIINSNLSAFKQLYAICPDVNIADHNHRKLVHYAAAATTVNGLKFLSNNGANLEDIDKEGKTPLMLACDTGRAHNVEFILSTLKAKNGGDIATNPLLKKMGIGGLNRPDKSSWCAIHYAVDENRIDVVKVLVKYEANFEKQLNANLGKVTPLMMAAANGDLEMVKLLVNHAKIEKHDRYKRTALTHAVMNGSAHVASFLLSMGANPNKLDTSGNSNLHYACAYGWYFCMKTLLEAGAEVNACNEWKLTPVAVSLLKGHVGISKFLLDQPGVDINFKDDKGRTVILSMLAEVNNEKRLTEELYSEIVDMVERRGADAKVIDNDKNNALHFLCSYNTVPCLEAGVSLKKEWLENKKLLEKFVKFFIKKGASVLQLNTSFMLPFNNAQVRVDSFSRKNYQILNILTDAMNSAAKGHDAPKLEFEKNKANPLHAYLNDLSFVGIEEEFELFKSLMVCFNSLNKKGLIAPHMDTLIEGTQSSKDGKTPFMVLCNGYAGIQLKSSFHHSIKNEDHALDLYPDLKLNDKDELEGYSDRIGIFTDFIQYMVDLGVNLVVEVPTESTYNGRKVVRNVLVSSFLTLVSASIPIKEYPSRLAYEIVMPKESRIDLTDINGKTSLNRSVIAQDIELSTRLLKLRANVNHAYESTEKQTIDKENHVFLKYSPLLDAVRNGNRDMIKLLLNNNADVHLASTKVKAKDGEYYQKNLINVATDKCMSSRGNKVYQAILRDLLDAGTDINILDKITKRNVLHQAINNSSDSSDQSLDLEIALLRNKCDIFAKDIRQRFPLHYAFVKVGQHRESRRIDPIEVCSMVVEAMGSKRVDEPDEFGSTPLHYAAYRGATVSCLLLLQKGADINAVDKHGNTPLAYSVLGKHEGCALILLQKGANVNVDIVPLANPGESGADESEKSPEEQFRYLPIHFMPKSLNKPYSLFQGVILNDWLGITYMTLQQLEVFGMSYAMAIHVALANGKIQFAKTLIAKQVSVEKLKQKVEQKRNLIHCLANECKSGDRSDIQVDILELLLQADVSPAEKDVHGCSPLHYACKNQNLELIKVLLKEDRVIRSINVMNNLEISPFGAIFWNMVSKQSNFSDIIKVMLENGADPDVVMPFKPISYLQSGYTIQSKNKTGFEEFKDMLKITPLICSVVHRDEDLIELLLNNKHKVCNINLEDEKGMTPLMHAAKTNDILIAKQLIYNNGIKINKVDPLVLTPHLNINASDLDGYNAINHIIELDINAPIRCTFDNPKMFELLETIGVKIKPIITPDGNSRTPKDVAAEVGAINLHKKMSGVLAKTASTIPWISGAKGIEVPQVNDGIVWEDEFNFDIKKDSKKMLKRLEIEATKELERKKKEALEAGRSLDSLEMEIDANGVDSEEE